jgi:hypothetical protein
MMPLVSVIFLFAGFARRLLGLVVMVAPALALLAPVQAGTRSFLVLRDLPGVGCRPFVGLGGSEGYRTPSQQGSERADHDVLPHDNPLRFVPATFLARYVEEDIETPMTVSC